jgi:regulator of replication initiation timing
MGSSTEASGFESTAMGSITEASGFASTAMGSNSEAAGDYSTAIGEYISVTGDGSMYLADASRFAFQVDTRGTNNRFYARFDNGYFLYTDATSLIGVLMSNGDNSWSSISDSTKKENFLPADGKDFLNKISGMKLGSWNYKKQDPEKYRHYGPMAQEFHALFGEDGIGTIGNDTTIATADIDGVMMIAIQALVKENEELKAQNSELHTQLDNLDEVNSEMREEIEELKKTQVRTSALLKVISERIATSEKTNREVAELSQKE